MAFDTVHIYDDDESPMKVEKQHRRRDSRGNETRYKIEVAPGKFFHVTRTQFLDLVDFLNDAAKAILDGTL